MMTDRELLELAAKAAGIEYDAEASKPHPVSKAFWGLWLVIHGEPSEYQRRNWNPLADDGDALRLAIYLKLPIKDGLNGTIETGNSESGRPIWEIYGSDPYAATRRAIVRAAAEIGRAM